MPKKIYCCYACAVTLFFLNIFNTYSQTFTSVSDWPMPDGDVRGLVTPGFKVVPKFLVVRLGSEVHVQLLMDITMSTAQNPVAPFSYRYLFHGKVYTDQHLGPQAFYPIKLARAVFSVRVHGPDTYNKQIEYNSVIDRFDLGIFSKDVKAEQFAAHVQALHEVSYHGTEGIELAITNMESVAKTKAENDAKLAAQKQAGAEKQKQTAVQHVTKPQPLSNTKPTNAAVSQSDNFWSERPVPQSLEPGKLIPEQAIHKNLPDFVRTTDGGYYHRGADGRFRQLTAEEYEQAKKSVAPKDRQLQPEIPKLTSEQVRGKINRMFADAKARNDAVTRQIEQKTDAWRQSFYYAEAIRNGKENLAGLSTLNGNYDSVQELEADFNQKYNAIHAEVNGLEQARNAQLANATAANFNGSSTEQAIGQSVNLIGGFVNSLKADKEAKEAHAALAAERKRQLTAIELKKKQARTDMRNKLMQSFPDGGTPLTSHKVTAPQVYMFAYITEKTSFTNEQAAVSVSNVFPVAQYSDGTYPYKTTVTNKLKGYAPGDVVLIGYYADKSRAELMRNSFINLATKSELSVKAFTLKTVHGSSSGGAAVTGDFWEAGKKGVPAEKKPAEKKSDFWNN